MAPKKNTKVANDIQSTPEKPRRSSRRIAKTKSKTFTYTEIEIFDKKVCESPHKVTKKQTLTLYDERKIALANEVVRHQLKRNLQTFDFTVDSPIDVNIINNKGKPKNVLSKYFTSPGLDGKVNENPKKKVTKKIPTDSNMVPRKPITRKRSADSTQKLEKCPKLEKDNVEPKRRPICGNSTVVQKIPRKIIIEGKDQVAEELTDKIKESLSTIINVQSTEAKCAGRIDSRKTSSTSYSCMSWTKDLSSSATNSIVAKSSDFVRIDKKIPVLKLTNIDSKITNENERDVNNDDISLLDSDSSDSTETEISIDTFDIQSQNLNLSTSSQSSLSKSSINSPRNNTMKNELNKAFDKLTSTLNSFDIEIMNWIGYGKDDTDINRKDLQDKILETLKEEYEVITHCRNFKNILSGEGELNVPLPSVKESGEMVEQTHIDKIDKIDVTSRNVPECGSEDVNSLVQQTVCNIFPEKKYNDNVKSKSDECDDEDALSIYAESITGIESEQVNNSVKQPSEHVDFEYIPEPVKKTESPPKKYTYCPTKINENNQLTVKKTVCEKQNADSTSLFKDKFYDNVSEDDFQNISNKSTQDNLNNYSTKLDDPLMTKSNTEPYLINNIRKPDGRISVIFKNICLFNLVNNCNNTMCRFLHIVPDDLEVKNKLHALNTDAFISEYMTIRNFYTIRRKYGICFVEECCVRDIPRVLVEMATYFFVNANIKCKEDTEYIREILERILLRLNTVNLSVCEDLLLCFVTPTMLLCDVFMQTIAETQNFFRFKIVFLNLTHFIVSHSGIFNLFVSGHVLERVCILPPEEELSRAILHILKNTHPAIFRNNMISKFENILLSLDKDLHNDLLAIKMEAGVSSVATLSGSNVSPIYNNNVEPVVTVNTSMKLGDKSYTSPDTTDINGLKNKLASAMNLNMTRTVNFNRSYFKKPNKPNASNDSEHWQTTDNFTHWKQKIENYTMWRQKSPQTYPPPLLSLTGIKPVLRSRKSNRHVAYRRIGYQRKQVREY